MSVWSECHGYSIGNHLRRAPAFKLACGRLPDTDRDLCSQPTLSRLENAPDLREVIRLSVRLSICGWTVTSVRRARDITPALR